MEKSTKARAPKAILANHAAPLQIVKNLFIPYKTLIN
jgi:hypothetical protein